MALDYTSLKFAVQNSVPVSINRRGEFVESGWLTRAANAIRRRPPDYSKVADLFIRMFDIAERRGDYLPQMVEVAEALSDRLCGKRRSLLQRRIVAASYRQGNAPIIEHSPIKAVAEEWLKRQKFLLSLDEEKISEVERKYPAFTVLLASDRYLQDEFFTRTMRECLAVEPMVEFPGTMQRLRECFITGDVGRFAYEGVLECVRNKEGRKFVRLPFDGTMINILDEEAEVTLGGDNYVPDVRVTIREIFEDNAARNDRPQRFMFMGKRGFINWCSRMSRWDGSKEVPIAIDAENWWEQLPCFELLEVEDIKQRYGIESLSQDQWLAVAMAARHAPNIKIDNCHGYLHLLRPDGKGQWQLFELGKYAKSWPSTSCGKLGMLDNTVYSDILYPDPNTFYSFRQLAAVPYPLTAEQGTKMLSFVQRDIKRAMNNQLVFQFAWENCAYWPQTLLAETLPQQENLFKTHILKSGSENPGLEVIFRFIRLLPKWLHDFCVWLSEIILVPWRGVSVKEGEKEVRKTLVVTPFHKGPDCHKIFLPSALHKKIHKGRRSGLLSSGHLHVQRKNSVNGSQEVVT